MANPKTSGPAKKTGPRSAPERDAQQSQQGGDRRQQGDAAAPAADGESPPRAPFRPVDDP